MSRKVILFLTLMLFTMSMAVATGLVAIRDIQYTTDPSGDSPLKGTEVTISGVVTGQIGIFSGSYYFVQDAEGPWNGIKVYDADRAEALEGNWVTITGTVDEYYNETEIVAVTSFVVDNTGVPLFEATPVTTGEAADEQYEGCLIALANATVTNADLGYGECEVDDGSGSFRIDDQAEYLYTPVADDVFESIRGICVYTYNNYKLWPRLANDLPTLNGYTRIQAVQQVRETDLEARVDSSYVEGDTLTVEGIVVAPSGLFYAGTGITVYMQDMNGGPYSGIMSYGPAPTDIEQLYVGDRVRVKAIVEEYWWNQPGEWDFVSMTELRNVEAFQLVAEDQTTPEPMDITTGEIDSTNGADVLAEKYEGALVRVQNVTIDSTNQFGNWRIDDGTGKAWLRIASDSLQGYGTPPIGTLFTEITGVIYNRFGVYMLQPRFPSDLVLSAGAPIITGVKHEPEAPTPTDEITFSASVQDESTVTDVTLHYTIDRGPWETKAMDHLSGFLYQTKLGPYDDGTHVAYYVSATDNDANTSLNPETAPDSAFEFVVSGATVTDIHSVQYTDDPSGDSPFKGQIVTVTGVVTAPKGMYAPNTNRDLFIQDTGDPYGTGGAWNGVLVYNHETNSQVIMEVALGDCVSVTGLVNEYYGKTEIQDIVTYQILKSGVALPEPVLLPTAHLATGAAEAEQYEGVLVKVENAIVTNPDMGYGEYEINDGSGACRVDDWAEYSYVPAEADKISWLVGIVDYGYNNFKLQPRWDDDFGPIISDVETNIANVPLTFDLAQNYPNPFNPTTTIDYQLPRADEVRIDIYNTLGQKVRTLVDTRNAPGYYSVVWDGRDNHGELVTTGVYLYRIHAGRFIKTMKMLYVR